MNTINDEERLSRIPASERILLLSHCLRHTDTCQNKYGKWGLECRDCNAECSINRLRQAALNLGYKGICIAPGGRMALKYVKETNPRGIVAVACQMELEEGTQGVTHLYPDEAGMPTIVVVPLSKDGCVDTEVDEERALEIIALGCSRELAQIKV